MKETNIRMFASFKKDLMMKDDSKIANLLKQHEMYDLIFSLKMHGPYNSILNSNDSTVRIVNNESKCECMNNCFYTPSNLRLIFYHK